MRGAFSIVFGIGCRESPVATMSGKYRLPLFECRRYGEGSRELVVGDWSSHPASSRVMSYIHHAINQNHLPTQLPSWFETNK